MMALLRGVGCGWWVVSLVCSLVYGIAAPRYYWPDDKRQYRDKHDKHDPETFWVVWWWIHQPIFNFLGAFVGWAVLYWLCYSVEPRDVGIAHFVGLAIAFLGITGNLPYIARQIKVGG